MTALRALTVSTAKLLASFAADDLVRARDHAERMALRSIVPGLQRFHAERVGYLRGRAFRALEDVYDAGMLPLCTEGR